jgi:hypothetical protein
VAAGQDAGHNGTVIFDFTADGNASNRTAINITANNVTVDGNYGGNNHIECTNIVNTSTATNGICLNGNSHSGLTVDHIWAQNVNNGVKNTSVAGTVIKNSSFNQIRGDAAIALAGSTGTFDATVVDSNYIETVCQQGSVCDNGGVGNGGPDGVQNGSGVTIKNNTFKEIVMNFTTSDQHPDMIQNQGDYTKVYGNDFQNVGDSNFDFDAFADSTPHDIWIYNNQFRIITQIDSFPDFIRVYSSGAALTNITNFKIMNNVFADNNVGSNIPPIGICQPQANGGGSTPCNAAGGGTGSQITNNIFVNNGGGGSSGPMLWLSASGGSNWAVGNNVYYRPSNGFVTWKGTSYSAANFVANVDTAGKTSLPTFTSYSANAAGNDFHLSTSDSVAKDTGISLSSLFTVDKNGTARPQGSAWDMGPYEYIGGSCPAGDLNSDCHVTITDLSILLSHYGQSATSSQGDINNDGTCNILDLSLLLSHYGT